VSRWHGSKVLKVAHPFPAKKLCGTGVKKVHKLLIYLLAMPILV
jgi:hypothetical protein